MMSIDVWDGTLLCQKIRFFLSKERKEGKDISEQKILFWYCAMLVSFIVVFGKTKCEEA